MFCPDTDLMQRCGVHTAFQTGWAAGHRFGQLSWVHGLSCPRLVSHSAQPNFLKKRSHAQVLRIAARGNGTEPAPSDGADDEDMTSLGKIDPAIAKEKLLELITKLINDDAQIQEVEKLILELESIRATPITDVFTEMGLSGNWKLMFSSTRTRSGGNVRIRKIGQSFNTEKKLLINSANWSFAAKNGVDQIAADLNIICSYTFVGPGRLEVTVEEHKIKILESNDGKKNEMPSDLQALITELQLALPIDFFDPSGLIDVSYMEPNFRLARFVGKRIAGVRNVFVRDIPG